MMIFVMQLLTKVDVQPAIMYIVMVLEISYILIRFLLIVIPKEHKAHQILLRVFQGLKQVEKDIKDQSPKDDDDN